MRTAVHVAGVIIAALWIGACSSVRSGVRAATSDAEELVGTWQLVAVTTAGHPDLTRGPHPKGLIYYDRTGHMAAQIMPDRKRPAFASSEPTPDEAKAALAGYTAYFGTYAVDERARTVTHHRIGNLEPGRPVDRVRQYEFVSRDRLILTPLEEPDTRLTWDRLR